MSAWMCSNDHINAIVTFAVDHKIITESQAELTGKMLFRANAYSLKVRYGDKISLKDYSFKRVAQSINDVYSLCISYQYQSCEYNTFTKSKSYDFIEGVKWLTGITGDTTGKWEI